VLNQLWTYSIWKELCRVWSNGKLEWLLTMLGPFHDEKTSTHPQTKTYIIFSYIGLILASKFPPFFYSRARINIVMKLINEMLLNVASNQIFQCTQERNNLLGTYNRPVNCMFYFTYLLELKTYIKYFSIL
jgi:hypothetical protein